MLGTWPLYSLLFIPSCLYTLYVIYRACRAREADSLLGLCGLGFVALTHINDVLAFSMIIPQIFVGQYGWAILLFCNSLIVGRRFARTYAQTKVLSEELQIKNIELDLRRCEIEKLNDNLRDYNETLELKVEEKTRDIKSILRSIRQGRRA